MDGIFNAQITSTVLGLERDHNVLTGMVFVDYDCGSQGYGGYNLNSSMSKFVGGVLTTLGIDSWEKLPGEYCRIDVQKGMIKRIGHIIKDRWFSMETEKDGD